MSDRQVDEFGSLLAIPTRNGIHKGPKFQGRGVAVVKMGEVYNADLVTPAERDRYELTDSEAARLAVEQGDLLFCRTSLVPEGVGHCAMVGVLSEPTVFASNLIRVRLDRKKAIPRYWFYYFRSSIGGQQLHSLARGTSVTTITGPDIAALDVRVPSLEEQQRIAWALGSLDDKIENNRCIAETLERIAATLFRGRFVDFVDHDDLVEGELGRIPSRWSLVPVGDLAEYVNGKNFTKYGNGGGRMVIRIAELRSGPGKATVYTDHEAESQFMASPGDILFAWSGSLDAYRWYRADALINQHIFKVIPQGYPAWFVYHALKHVMPQFQAIAADKATTMGHIKRSHLSEFSVAVPPADVLNERDREFAPIFERALQARIEMETLAQIRDRLLSRVISGELRMTPTDPVGAA